MPADLRGADDRLYRCWWLMLGYGASQSTRMKLMDDLRDGFNTPQTSSQ